MTSITMLGAGFIGQMHALSIRSCENSRHILNQKPRLLRLIEREEAKKSATQTAARFGFEELRLEPWQDLVKSDDCDLFVNAGPNPVHADASIAFAQAGKHVFCEKPLAGSANEAHRAWAGVHSTGVKHMCAFVHRFIPAIKQMRRMILAGDIGEVLHYRSQFLLDMRDPSGALSWRFSEPGGGAAGDLGSHHIDVARFLVGEIEEISAFTRTSSKDPEGKLKHITDDSFVAVATLANGAVATFDASRIVGGHALTGRIEVDGTKGSISFDMERLNELRLSVNRGGWRTFLITGPDHPYADFYLPVGIQGAHPVSWRDCFAYQMHHMLQAVQQGSNVAELGATFEDGYRVAEIVEAVIAASEERAVKKVKYRNHSDRSA
ncbi:Gfo/Idh/MocA family protein [Rhizobium sp. 18055]|uniref:Gfo/Idh/MocA family protein n=1 Tax=Rhizobium sp. 18055 TaxID=2681403 RepID=UPI00135B0BA6|nr:Gfo/Idh/MocA family oxidoreductase [Rhizobium sp. 18055]